MWLPCLFGGHEWGEWVLGAEREWRRCRCCKKVEYRPVTLNRQPAPNKPDKAGVRDE